MSKTATTPAPIDPALFARFLAFEAFLASQGKATTEAKPQAKPAKGKKAPKAPAPKAQVRKLCKDSRAAFVAEHEWALGLSTLQIVEAALVEPDEFPIGEGWTISPAWVNKALLGTWS